MKWSQLPPVGTRALPHSKDYRSSPLTFSGFDHQLVNSGTAALGAILAWAVQRNADANFNVVVPGYACPDLVAACDYAGAHVLIVDLAADAYQYNLTQLATLEQPVHAVICPALFGLSMPLADIRQAVGDQALLIEDNAQWFPEKRYTSQLASLKNYPLPEATEQADFFICSFGRGKPVNLLGGGLLAWNTSRISDFAPQVGPAPDAPHGYNTKARLFNAICQPLAYGALTRLPGLNLGATEYHPLSEVTQLDSLREQRLPPSILAYLRQRPYPQQILLAAIPVLWPQQARAKRLLRFPLLTQSKQARETLLRALNQAGLGASPMYASTLPAIAGVAERSATCGPLPVSQALADQLITLPVHQGVKPHHLRRIIKIVDNHRQWLTDRPFQE